MSRLRTCSKVDLDELSALVSMVTRWTLLNWKPRISRPAI